MFAYTLSLALALVPFVSAAIIDVQVGASGQLLYSPEAIGASVGDQVVFHFHAKNHTVTQSSFADPCGKLDGGISSGFMPVAVNQTDNLPTFTVQVKDTKPIWVYCAQAALTPASHCGAGMVFAINCGADGAPNSFTNFKKSALAVGASLAAAASASATPSSGGYGGGYGAGSAPAATGTASAAWTTAAYGGVTIPAAPEATPVTAAVTLGTETWTTTYGSYPGSPDPTPASTTGNVIKVIVGGTGILAFDPPRVDAKPRDTIVFEFHQKNHTVTQSSFDDPCRKMSTGGITGFDSGFMPFNDTSAPFPTFNFTVTDTAPVWAYCRQQLPSSHCGAGMVFAINSDESSGRNFAAFQNVAKALNGTAIAAVAAPAATTTTAASAAAAVKVGPISLTLFAAALVGSLVL